MTGGSVIYDTADLAVQCSFNRVCASASKPTGEERDGEKDRRSIQTYFVTPSSQVKKTTARPEIYSFQCKSANSWNRLGEYKELLAVERDLRRKARCCFMSNKRICHGIDTSVPFKATVRQLCAYIFVFYCESSSRSRAFILPGFTLSLHLSELGRLAETAGCQGKNSDTRRPFHRLPTSPTAHRNSDGRLYLPFTALDARIFLEATK